MKSSVFALIAFGMLLTFVQCKSKNIAAAEYEIQQGLLSGGRTYSITGKTNSASRFSTKNELFSIGKKLTLLQDGKDRFIVKHELLNLMSTWRIIDAINGREIGTIKNQLKLVGSRIEANGEFGHYVIKGNFGNHSFKILKNKHKVAKIDKKRFHLHDTYGLTVYDDADQALMVVFAIIVDEIREH